MQKTINCNQSAEAGMTVSLRTMHAQVVYTTNIKH